MDFFTVISCRKMKCELSTGTNYLWKNTVQNIMPIVKLNIVILYLPTVKIFVVSKQP